MVSIDTKQLHNMEKVSINAQLRILKANKITKYFKDKTARFL